MSRHPSPDDLPARLQAGDPEAAREVFDRYAHLLIGVAVRRLPPGLRPKVDGEDVVQSVFRSFFRHTQAGHFRFESEEGVRGLLVTITRRKCGKLTRHYFGAEHDVRKEVAAASDGDDAAAADLLDKEPSPEEEARAAELLEQCMRQLDERERRVLLLDLEGLTAQEISGQVGLTRYTVEGILKRVRKRLEHLREDGGCP
jgi:RNA polymerase sigma-70 factor (ECF subfamily)